MNTSGPIEMTVAGVPGVWVPDGYAHQPPPEPEFDPTRFFDSVRESVFRGSLNQKQVDGLNLIGTTCKAAGLDPLIEQAAYVLSLIHISEPTRLC